MKIVIAAILILALSGCSRNEPEQQVADYKVCISGGMQAWQTFSGEIRCMP